MMAERQSWRLIKTDAMAGARNMAIDESILKSVSLGESPPTLRLYSWVPPCLSLGYAQPFADVDVKRVSERGWSIVRRPTGGRAILHTDELTYAVIAPINHPDLAGGVVSSYQRLSQALMLGLELIGLKVNVAPEIKLSDQERNNPVCFEVPSSYEIEVAGRKLLGSAQVRRVKGVLQHGTLPLSGDITRICEALRFPDEEAREKARVRVRTRAASVSELMGVPVSWEQAAGALIQGFEGALGWKLEESDLSARELERAYEFQVSRYASPLWTERI
jgi:lipoate-protein ligase A